MKYVVLMTLDTDHDDASKVKQLVEGSLQQHSVTDVCVGSVPTESAHLMKELGQLYFLPMYSVEREKKLKSWN